MFSRIAVINRGEPAVRLIRAVRELNSEFGYGIKVVALHTEAERGALSSKYSGSGSKASTESACTENMPPRRVDTEAIGRIALRRIVPSCVMPSPVCAAASDANNRV